MIKKGNNIMANNKLGGMNPRVLDKEVEYLWLWHKLVGLVVVPNDGRYETPYHEKLMVDVGLDRNSGIMFDDVARGYLNYWDLYSSDDWTIMAYGTNDADMGISELMRVYSLIARRTRIDKKGYVGY